MSVLTQVIQERQRWGDVRRAQYTAREVTRLTLEGLLLVSLAVGFFQYKEQFLNLLNTVLSVGG